MPKKHWELLQWPLAAYLCRDHRGRIYFIWDPTFSIKIQAAAPRPPIQPTLTSSLATRARTALNPGSASLRAALELLPGCPPSPTTHSGLIPPQINILSPISTHLHKTHLLFCSLVLAQLLQKKTPDSRTDNPHPFRGVLVAHGPLSCPLQGLISARAAWLKITSLPWEWPISGDRSMTRYKCGPFASRWDNSKGLCLLHGSPGHQLSPWAASQPSSPVPSPASSTLPQGSIRVCSPVHFSDSNVCPRSWIPGNPT